MSLFIGDCGPIIVPDKLALAEWVVETFGPRTMELDERSMRLFEEAGELLQAAGVDLDTASKILARVYSRPPGKVPQEAGQVFNSLLTLGVAAGIDVATEARLEFDRVLGADQSDLRQRHEAKVAAGTAKG